MECKNRKELSFRFVRDEKDPQRLILVARARAENRCGSQVGVLRLRFLQDRDEACIENANASEDVHSELVRQLERSARIFFGCRRVVCTVTAHSIGFYLSRDYHVADVVLGKENIFEMRKHLYL